MTFWDFMYIVGAGVSFLMIISMTGVLENKDKGQVIMGVCILTLLSWAVPICWLCSRLIEKGVKEND